MKISKLVLVTMIMFCIVFTGCVNKNGDVKNSPEPVTVYSLKLTPDEYPRVNGSTPTSTLSSIVYEALTGNKLDENNDKVNHEGTSASYESLIAGRCDIIISQQASPDVENQLKKVAIIEPVAKDGLVMITTKENDIQNLTLAQLNGIFTGIYKNWNEVGAQDNPILTVQRNESGGSQILLDKFIMKGKPMKAVPDFLKPTSMSDMSTAVIDFSNNGQTIGYSTYYYVSTFDVRENLKMISINNILPSKETISNGSYPITSEIYVSIRKNEPIDSPARKMYNWLLSEEGQKVVAKSGYPSVLK